MKKIIVPVLLLVFVALITMPTSLVSSQGRGSNVCENSNVKYEVEEEDYDQTDKTATVSISEDELTVTWQSAPGYVITEVCIKAAPGNQDLIYPEPTDGEWTSAQHPIAHIVLTTEPSSDGTVPSGADDPETDISLIIVHHAETGTLIENEDNTYTLTLIDVFALTFWFTDEPARKVGYMATQDFIDTWSELSYLSVLETDTSVIALELSVPIYDAENAELSFIAIPSNTLPDFSIYENVSDKLPADLKNPVIFIEAYTSSEFLP